MQLAKRRSRRLLISERLAPIKYFFAVCNSYYKPTNPQSITQIATEDM